MVKISGDLKYRYFYDLEFEENGETIIPVSLAMVSDDGRELYIINREYMQTYKNLEGYYWKGKYRSEVTEWLADNVCEHITQEEIDDFGVDYENWGSVIQGFISHEGRVTSRDSVELWAYFASYDHVALAQAFGRMIELPEPIPMFTHDLKQALGDRKVPFEPECEHHALADARWNKRVWEYYVMNNER